MPAAARALREATAAASLLNTAVTRFLAEPTADTRANAEAAWHAAHDAWLATWSSAAILTGAEMPRHAFNIDAWPVTPGFLDTLPDYPQSGMVTDVTLPLTPGAVRDQHGFSDASEVALGFHAIWHLLATRELEDFAGDSEVIERRRALLALQAELLLEDLQQLDAARRPSNLTAVELMPASLATLNEALLAIPADDDSGHATANGPQHAANSLARPVVTWLRQDTTRTWLNAAHPTASQSLLDAVAMLETAGSARSVGHAEPADSVEPADAEASPTALPDTPRLTLALRASIQILGEIVETERARGAER